MYCANCGQALGDNASFCGSCGTPVKSGAVAKASDDVAQASGKKSLLPIAIVATALVIGALIVFLSMQGGQGASEQQTPLAESSAESATTTSSSTEASSSSSSASASSTTSSSNGFDPVKAEAEALAAAEAAGKQIYTGIVVVKDSAARMEETGELRAWDPDQYNPTFVYLELDEPATVTARNSDGATYRERPYITREGIETILFEGSGGSEEALERWAPFEGQRITIAASKEEMRYFSDVAGVLFGSAATNATVIAPLNSAEDAEAATEALSDGE